MYWVRRDYQRWCSTSANIFASPNIDTDWSASGKNVTCTLTVPAERHHAQIKKGATGHCMWMRPL